MDGPLLEKLERLPTGPGVYLMRDRTGSIIYVGKAVNLRSRVRSYFSRSSDERAFVGLLGRILGDIETVLVQNEKEALLLENELIKRHRPRFNVQLRDDKNFICLRLDERHPYPRLEIVRRFGDDGARYFGPYSSASSIRQTLKIISRHFQLRSCSDHVLENRRRPCLLHQLGRCPAPCVFEIPRDEYRRSVEDVTLFLEGRADTLVAELRARIDAAAAELAFERAAHLRDQLFAIERSLERQKVALVDGGDQDVIGFFREADRLVFYVLLVRAGRIAGGQPYHFSGLEFPDEELLGSFINLFYAQESFVPKEVLLPFELTEDVGLTELLSERRGERVRLATPKKGEKRALVEMACENAAHALAERRRTKDEQGMVLERLMKRLALARVPRRIECFDVSHFGGVGLVASQVASVDGELDRSRYRRFRIKSGDKNDDFASMHEVLTRRLRRGLLASDLPDLIVVDGGKGQLASAHAALTDLGVAGVDVVGLAKSRLLSAREGGAEIERSPERVFLVGRKDPIVLPASSPELFVLTRLRDEAHRFAITYQKKLARRRNLRSELEAIPGVGPTRRRALLRHFGSVRRLREASLDEIAAVEGISRAVAERVHARLQHGHAEGGRQPT